MRIFSKDHGKTQILSKNRRKNEKFRQRLAQIVRTSMLAKFKSM